MKSSIQEQYENGEDVSGPCVWRAKLDTLSAFPMSLPSSKAHVSTAAQVYTQYMTTTRYNEKKWHCQLFSCVPGVTYTIKIVQSGIRDVVKPYTRLKETIKSFTMQSSMARHMVHSIWNDRLKHETRKHSSDDAKHETISGKSDSISSRIVSSTSTTTGTTTSSISDETLVDISQSDGTHACVKNQITENWKNSVSVRFDGIARWCRSTGQHDRNQSADEDCHRWQDPFSRDHLRPRKNQQQRK